MNAATFGVLARLPLSRLNGNSRAQWNPFAQRARHPWAAVHVGCAGPCIRGGTILCVQTATTAAQDMQSGIRFVRHGSVLLLEWGGLLQVQPEARAEHQYRLQLRQRYAGCLQPARRRCE